MSVNNKLRVKTLIVIGLMIGCTSPPESHNAKVGDAKQAPDDTPASTLFTIDQSSSSITWVGTKPTGRHRGYVSIKEGYISVQKDSVVNGNMEIDMHTIAIQDLTKDSEDYTKLLSHLKSKDFFDVNNFPSAFFTITNVVKLIDQDNSEFNVKENDFNLSNPTHLVTGNMSIKAITLSITFPCQLKFEGKQILAKARFNIDRTKWGVSYNQESKFVDKAKDGLINNTVFIGFDLAIPTDKSL